MDYTPRAETVRQLAAAAYLPLVAIYLLSSRRYREVRLVRFHAHQAIGIAVVLVLVLLFASGASSLFGGLPGVGYLINLGVGVALMLAFTLASGLSFYGAYMGYSGNYTQVPLLTEWTWQQVNGGRPAGVPQTRKRRRVPKEEDEIDWDELPMPAPEDRP